MGVYDCSLSGCIHLTVLPYMHPPVLACFASVECLLRLQEAV